MSSQPEPRLMVHRVADPRRTVHVARALSVLEDDLRFLLANDVPIGPEVAEFFAARYRHWREQLIELYDEPTAADAARADIGMPELPDGATLAHLLVLLSQATRFVGVEEGWPVLLAQSGEQAQAIAAGLAAAPEPSSGTGPGYI